MLYTFNGIDGCEPYGTLAAARAGVLFGATRFGPTEAGTVFALRPPTSPGGAWTEAVLYSFTGHSDRGEPLGGVVIGSGGVLYGTTSTGGASGAGTVFSLTPPASPGGAWTQAVLHNFTCGGDGCFPSGVVIGSGGVLYGVTAAGGGGTACQRNCGTVFSLIPPASPGGAWTEAVLSRD